MEYICNKRDWQGDIWDYYVLVGNKITEKKLEYQFGKFSADNLAEIRRWGKVLVITPRHEDHDQYGVLFAYEFNSTLIENENYELLNEIGCANWIIDDVND